MERRRTTLTLPLNRKQRIREAILRLFSHPQRSQNEWLEYLAERDWRQVLTWLDVSGLAIYFLDRVTELNLLRSLPSFVLERLQSNSNDNVARTRGMIQESVNLQLEFQRAGISYALLKGLSLSPLSVPRPQLRHQFDLDYLVAEEDLTLAAQVLEQRGYLLYAISGTTWEYKLNASSYVPMRDMYRDLPGRAVELHAEPRALRLDHAIDRHMYGVRMPVLSPADLFLHQGLHAFKDVCSPCSRAAHLLEFYRHVLAHREDDAFWRQLRAKAETDRRAVLGLGVVTCLLTLIMGDFAPRGLECWTVHKLPPPVRLWIERYGRRAAFEAFPGTKMFLLLQEELEIAGVPAKRAVKEALLPLRLPPPVIHRPVKASAGEHFRRQLLYWNHILTRLRFHFVEGLRYAWESHQWCHLKRGAKRCLCDPQL